MSIRIVLVVAFLGACGRIGFDPGGARGDGGNDAFVLTECNDGIDNDGDGLVDWQGDLGCYGPTDPTEAAGSRASEAGWTTFDLSPGTRVIYVSSSAGSDSNDGLAPSSPLATIAAGIAKLRAGQPDWLLLRRGDNWRENINLGARSGPDAANRIIIASYGDGTERPIILAGTTNGLDMSGSNVAILDLDFYADTRDPASPTFAMSAANRGIYFCCAGGSDLLVEGTRIRFFGDAFVQGGNGSPTNFEFRRNVLAQTYGGGGMGLYSYSSTGLLVEENLFDHNGWNEQVSGAGALPSGSSLNLDSVQNATIRGNIFLRSSSQSLRFTSNSMAGVAHAVVDDNLFVEGEISIHAVGNGVAYRYNDLTITNNVGESLGSTQPTGRNIAWGIYLCDVDLATVTGNLLLYQAVNTSGGAIQVVCPSARDITIEHNLTYEQATPHVLVSAAAGFTGIRVANNLFENKALTSYLVTQSGGFAGFTYADNHYQTAAAPNAWFQTGANASLATWVTSSGETGATSGAMTHPDADGRTVAAYQTMLGKPATVAAFADDVSAQQKLAWRPQYTASAFNAWVRAGFTLP